jgi:hypothetical protein
MVLAAIYFLTMHHGFQIRKAMPDYNVTSGLYIRHFHWRQFCDCTRSLLLTAAIETGQDCKFLLGLCLSYMI